MHEQLTDHEQAIIIDARRERWGAWPLLIEQAARLDVVIEALAEREEAQPYPDPDRLERVWALHERVLARLGRRQRSGPPPWVWDLPGYYDDAGAYHRSAGEGWRPVTALDDDDRAALARLRAPARG